MLLSVLHFPPSGLFLVGSFQNESERSLIFTVMLFLLITQKNKDLPALSWVAGWCCSTTVALSLSWTSESRTVQCLLWLLKFKDSKCASFVVNLNTPHHISVYNNTLFATVQHSVHPCLCTYTLAQNPHFKRSIYMLLLFLNIVVKTGFLHAEAQFASVVIGSMLALFWSCYSVINTINHT